MSDYDLVPAIRVPGGGTVHRGAAAYEQLWGQARGRAGLSAGPAVLAVDCYPGVEVVDIVAGLRAAAPEALVFELEDYAKSAAELQDMLAGRLTDDRVFGVMSNVALKDFYRAEAFESVLEQLVGIDRDVAVVGWGASAIPLSEPTVVLADLARWEIQQRFRRGAGNWRADNGAEDVLRKFKRGYFVEWRTADNHKRPLLESADFLLDTTGEAKLISGEVLRAGLQAAVSQPFRVVPFFDPGPWGGVWMRDKIGLPALEPGKNYAWCFDCVPEENSLLLRVGEDVIEVPSLDLVLSRPRELLGEQTFARFGAEFPIRFDFLDTVAGGNLSLQVHPLTDYIQRQFGMHYTQDESYYMLDAVAGAKVYLGLQDGIDAEQMLAELAAAQSGAEPFDAEKFVNVLPAKKHDHFLIPAGTVHASGSGSMVLEISATPYIFTFKLWDWGRLGLDGKPRPIHLEHGAANIQWERQSEFVRNELANRTEQVADGPGWTEERTGLHELEFIETRRHWFTGPVEHDTRGTVNVLNLVEGDRVLIESPTGAFEPFAVHYAETFLVPAAVGRYTISPAGTAQKYGTLKAYVRATERL
ncbi:MAG: class I mannose-6-phosphate isomerase [Renibacterium salmoninarum]|nr:class I mannose-6-phosphate isomerase [Renibacterium salmoninarum]